MGCTVRASAALSVSSKEQTTYVRPRGDVTTPRDVISSSKRNYSHTIMFVGGSMPENQHENKYSKGLYVHEGKHEYVDAMALCKGQWGCRAATCNAGWDECTLRNTKYGDQGEKKKSQYWTEELDKNLLKPDPESNTMFLQGTRYAGKFRPGKFRKAVYMTEKYDWRQASVKCSAMGPKCSAITCFGDKTGCTLRHGVAKPHANPLARRTFTAFPVSGSCYARSTSEQFNCGDWSKKEKPQPTHKDRYGRCWFPGKCFYDRFSCKRNVVACEFNRKIKGVRYCVYHEKSEKCEEWKTAEDNKNKPRPKKDRFGRCWLPCASEKTASMGNPWGFATCSCTRFACPRNDKDCKFKRNVHGVSWCVHHEESQTCNDEDYDFQEVQAQPESRYLIDSVEPTGVRRYSYDDAIEECKQAENCKAIVDPTWMKSTDSKQWLDQYSLHVQKSLDTGRAVWTGKKYGFVNRFKTYSEAIDECKKYENCKAVLCSKMGPDAWAHLPGMSAIETTGKIRKQKWGGEKSYLEWRDYHEARDRIDGSVSYWEWRSGDKGRWKRGQRIVEPHDCKLSAVSDETQLELSGNEARQYIFGPTPAGRTAGEWAKDDASFVTEPGYNGAEVDQVCDSDDEDEVDKNTGKAESRRERWGCNSDKDGSKPSKKLEEECIVGTQEKLEKCQETETK